MARYRMVAWRIHHSTRAGRASPEMHGEGLFEPRAWHPMYPMQDHRHPPQAPPSLHEMVRGLAPLGGVFARTQDGEPGMQAIWQGDQRLHECISARATPRRVKAL
jgi:hypothetical protein